MILWGPVLLLSSLVLAVPIENDESVSDDLVFPSQHCSRSQLIGWW